MSQLLTDTRNKLGKIASPDAFEALATAVLREAEPLYASIIHVGTNSDGRAIRSPVDGIAIYRAEGNRRLLMAQHTITARKDLKGKWLDQTKGDVFKAKAILAQERGRNAVEDATLVLTCTCDPSEDLIRDVHAAAGSALAVDLWPASRIADFLDRHPEGQWLRQRQFGDPAIRLSSSQAREISAKSVADYLPLVSRAEAIPRLLDSSLVRFAKESRGAGFVIGESGLGKSVALRRLCDEWLSNGGIAFVMPHEFVEQASTIEQAICSCLRQWSPELELGCGHAALSLASIEHPLLIVVEDVNRSSNPQRIVERLVGWSVAKKEGEKGSAGTHSWRLLCPVWRGNSGLSDSQLKDHVAQRSFVVDRFERSEAVAAIASKASTAGVSLTELEQNDLAEALGDDPLLIGLNRQWSAPSSDDAIRSYIDGIINDMADDILLAGDLRDALQSLCERMVEARCIYPGWTQIRLWFSEEDGVLPALRRLIEQGRIIHQEAHTGPERLAYRHDRVRDHLLGAAVVRLIVADRLGEDLWQEPYYSELIGLALPNLSAVTIHNAAKHNPPALFAALQKKGLDQHLRDELVKAAQSWADSTEFAGDANDQRRHHAMRFLARTDADFVLDLAKRFPFSYLQIEAMVRNGSARAAAARCASSDPGTNDRWRDRMIEHALSMHPNFISDLADLICSADTEPKLFEGALNLAGEIGDPKLCDALAARWASTEGKALTSGWLWASLRCCPPIDHPLAGELCELWRMMPTKERRGDNKHDSNPRWDIARHSLPGGFKRKPEPASIAFMIARSRKDRRLNHILTSILRKVNSTEAILHAAETAGRISRRAERSGGINFFASDLSREWSPDENGQALSENSRSALARIWRNKRRNRFDRKAAFLIWKQTPKAVELAELSALEADLVLADDALRCRLREGDQSALPLLKQRIWNTERGHYWWYNARRVGLGGLQEDVARFLDERRAKPPIDDGSSRGDHIVSELLMDARDDFAANSIVTHWDHLQFSPVFVQAALFLARPETVSLAHQALAESAEPGKLLEHIDSHWGVKTFERPGISEVAQLQTLEPVLKEISQLQFGDLYISHMFEAANDLGALEWRIEHLDPLITKSGRANCPYNKEALFASLDEEVAMTVSRDSRWFHIDHWFEWREKELWSRDALIEIIGEWAASRDNEHSAALLCETLLRFGERKDLRWLDRLSAERQETCADKISDCIYGVKRRALNGA